MIWSKTQIQDGLCRHLEFLQNWYFLASITTIDKSVILSPKNPCVTNIDLQTKFEANRSRNCWDRPVYVFPRWRPSAILDMFYPNFGPSSTFPLMGCILTANGIMIRSDATEIVILLLRGFGWKMPIRANFRQFGGFWPTKIIMSLIWPQRYALPPETRILRYCLLKSVQRCLM